MMFTLTKALKSLVRVGKIPQTTPLLILRDLRLKKTNCAFLVSQHQTSLLLKEVTAMIYCLKANSRCRELGKCLRAQNHDTSS